MYDDIFAGDDDPEDDGTVDPHLFTSSNLFSADGTPGSAQAAPGGLIFPEGELPDLFGSEHQTVSATSEAKNESPKSSDGDTSTVSIDT